MSNINLYVDFGSTFTKVCAIDIDKEEILGSAQACTTIYTDISEGLYNAINELFRQTGEIKFEEKYASSSLEEGLRMIVVGLVPHLSTEISKRAVLGAGVTLLKAYSYKLTDKDIDEIKNLDVDILLICGGTDGGNKDNVIYNSKKIALLDKDISIIYAGNKEAAFECRKILEQSFDDVRITENIMPQHKVLNVEPVRKTIKEAYVEKTIKLKCFSKVQRELSGILMPTPLAVLNAAVLLAKGVGKEYGLGELMVVEPGGSMTNVYSLSEGIPTNEEVIVQGLPEPYAKRTMEPDLGLRHTVSSLIEVCGINKVKKELKKLNESFKDLREHIMILNENVTFIPVKHEHINVDTALCTVAVETAVERHVGSLEESNPFVQTGKDLTNVKYVIGTGGPIIYSNNPKHILNGTMFKTKQQNLLKPKNPEFLIDKRYVMYALGMLGETHPSKAVRMLKKYLTKL